MPETEMTAAESVGPAILARSMHLAHGALRYPPLGHVFPDPGEMALALGLYVLGISPLTPGMLRGVRQARRLDRARRPLGGPHPEVE
jgi:hypothetical protein